MTNRTFSTDGVAHLKGLFANLDKRAPSWRDAKVVVTDRTPAGYGPTDSKEA